MFEKVVEKIVYIDRVVEIEVEKPKKIRKKALIDKSIKQKTLFDL